MLDEKLNRKIGNLGGLREGDQGEISDKAAPVLATPALTLAACAGATAVVSAYVAGRIVG